MVKKKVECPHCRKRFELLDAKKFQCRYCGKWRTRKYFYFLPDGRMVNLRCKICYGVKRIDKVKPTERRIINRKSYKYCPGHEKWTLESKFNKSSHTSDGKQGWCQGCNTEYRKSRRKKMKRIPVVE